jgi:hypothetical protein
LPHGVRRIFLSDGALLGPRTSNPGRQAPEDVPPSLVTWGAGHGISTVQPSPTPYGFGLGPTDLQRTNLPEEPLGFRRTGFSPVFSLLIPAFSLPPGPPLLTVWLLSRAERSPTARRKAKLKIQKAKRSGATARRRLPLSPFFLFNFAFPRTLRFGTVLEPPYIIGAGPHSASKLLRTLSMVAASKPTSWLSACSHFLLHLARFRDLSGRSGLFPSRR